MNVCVLAFRQAEATALLEDLRRLVADPRMTRTTKAANGAQVMHSHFAKAVALFL